MAEPGEFNVQRTGHWLQQAYHASRDFYAYLVFGRQLRPAEHHEVIIERLLWGGPLELILGPPGSGKSTIAVAYLEWVLGRDPNYRWLIVSEVEHGVAAEHLRTIGDTIQNNLRFRMCFGELKGETWNDRQLFVCE